MKKRWASLLVVVVLVAACGGASNSVDPTTTLPDQPTTSPTTQPSPTSPQPTDPVDEGDPGWLFPEQTGAGVTVVIIDRGIDYTHPDFINEDGTTRIKWIYDMTGQSHCDDTNPTPTVYTEDQINAALSTGTRTGHRDADGHGTATAGLAAGNGSALSDRRFRGVATEADLIVIKAASSGAPSIAGHAAEAAFTACLRDALAWLDERLDESAQPAVAIWNVGTQWGPMDGTSAWSRDIEQYFGGDRPGRVWVSPSGDEGGVPNHSGGEYSRDTPAEVRYQKTVASVSYPTLWYSGDVPAAVTVELADGRTVSASGPGDWAQEHGVYIAQYQPGSEFYPWESTSGDVAVYISIDAPVGSGTIRIEALGDGVGRFDLYGDLLGGYLATSTEFQDHLVEGRLTDLSTTRGVIVVGNHVYRDTYADMDGTTQSRSNEGAPDHLWTLSSGGPTRDGRLGIDITAPGQGQFASLSSESNYSQNRSVQPGEGEGQYVYFGGASASAPIVVGTIALMLEVDPTLTAEQVRDILHSTAVVDEHTGTVPNNDWGYGKLDIRAAVAAAAR